MEWTTRTMVMTIAVAALAGAWQDRVASAFDGAATIGCAELHAPAPGESPSGACRPGAETPKVTRQTIHGVLATDFGDVAATFEVVDGHAVFEGDIIAGTVAQVAGAVGARGAGRTSESARWPDAVVPYAIDPNLPNPARVHAAIAHWQAHTAIRFVRRSTEADYVVFQPGNGCSSYVGRIGGAQAVTLAAGCTTGSTIHEIGHAVGLWHEQSRADRNDHILINWSNVEPGREHNFQTYLERRVDGADYGSFDLGSIMMYGPFAFAIDGSRPTITRRDGTLYSAQRDGLSSVDLVAVRAMYPNAPLAAPTELTPGSASFDDVPALYGAPLRMRWNASSGAERYRVGIWFWDSAAEGWVYDGDHDAAINALDYTPPASGTYYAWHVTAWSGGVSSPTSEMAYLWYADLPPCATSLVRSSATLRWRGGVRRVSVVNPARCHWTATSNVSWITIVSTRPGTRRGNVRFTVASNPTSDHRVGTLDVGGQTFTVVQRPR